jgi:hypothetical protein
MTANPQAARGYLLPVLRPESHFAKCGLGRHGGWQGAGGAVGQRSGAVKAALVGSAPATPALITGAVTWLLLTARSDLAPPG